MGTYFSLTHPPKHATPICRFHFSTCYYTYNYYYYYYYSDSVLSAACSLLAERNSCELNPALRFQPSSSLPVRSRSHYLKRA